MKFYSTNKKAGEVDFETALFRGLAEDGGLFMPEALEGESGKVKVERWENKRRITLSEIALAVLGQFVDIPKADFKKIVEDTFNFPAPLVKLDENLYVLELFHGPTLSFKDFGARFMARVMEYYISDKRTGNSDQLKANSEQVNIVVATSGDTGSAVAQGFYGMKNARVFVLYPKGRVSKLQEQQMATLGENIVALEVEGDFDDCQRLAKQALLDKSLKNISSANSINVGRLLPQMVYYFFGYERYRKSQIANRKSSERPSFVVPSGNFGNLTAGLFAKKLGLPCGKFIAAVNKNSIVPEFLRTGKFAAKKTKMTLSSAMDVGLPSNWARIMELYRRPATSDQRQGEERKAILEDLEAITVTEAETKKTIRDVYKKYGYVCDPHTAVGIAAAEKIKNQKSKIKNLGSPSTSSGTNYPMIILATAHPAKFPEIVERAIGRKVDLPADLSRAAKNKKHSVVMKADYGKLKGLLLAE